MQDFGQFLLVVTFFVTLATAVTAVAGALTRNVALMRGARWGLYGSTVLACAMAIVLTHGFLTHDFGNKYIATYSDRDMPTIYLLAAFWGGEKGALLFWVTSLAVFSSIAVYTKRERSIVYLSWVVGVLSLAILFFLVLMVFETSPFETYMTGTGPDEGKGLNPLLQNPVMAFHPPALLTGYILFTIPFAFGMAALITGKLDEQWIADTRRWTIVSWTFLTVGLLLGCRWAYMEIGWGFWWMWDPVENAGLVPWFTSTAFLHSVMIQERRGMLKRWNVVLLTLTFLLTIFGTFLTRSQLIVSIHAFADSQLPNYFFGYLVAIFLFATGLITWRWRALRSEANIESALSRESAFVLNNVVLVFCAFVTLWGTLMGKITESEAVRGVLGLDDPQVWDEAKFNEIFAPTGVVLLFLMGVGPLISWRRATAKNFKRNFVKPLAWTAVFTTVLTVGVAWSEISQLQAAYQIGFGEAYSRLMGGLGVAEYLSFVVYFLSIFVLLSVWREFRLGAKIRTKKYGGTMLSSMVAMSAKNPRRYGGYLVHVGMVFLFIAFTGKVFKVEEPERLMGEGDRHAIADYVITYTGRERFWSDEEGCAVTKATMVVIPKKNTVATAEVDLAAGWIESLQLGKSMASTAMDSPKINVKFESEQARHEVLARFYLARGFQRDFLAVDANPQQRRMTFTIADAKLLRVMPMSAVETIRTARERISAADLGATVSSQPGSPRIDLTFADQAAYDRFDELITGSEVPAGIMAVVEDSEGGGVDIVAAATGVHLYPETRFYPKHRQSTTEVSISGAAFMEDVYISMQPTMGQPFVKLYMVVFPLVNFLWIGGLLLLFGAVICLIPRWLGQTLVAMTRPVRKPVAATAALFTLGAVLPCGGAQAARGPVQPQGMTAPADGDAMADLLTVLRCACGTGDSVEIQPYSLADARCECARRGTDMAVINDLLAIHSPEDQASGKAKLAVLYGLVEIDQRWDGRLIYDETVYEQVKSTTLNTCEGERGMTLSQSKMSCSVRSLWMPRFRALLASGATPDHIHTYYVAENNRTQKPSTPWTERDLHTSEERAAKFGVPAVVLASVGALLILLFVASKAKRKAMRELQTREVVGGSGAALSAEQRLLLEDEMDAYDS